MRSERLSHRRYAYLLSTPREICNSKTRGMRRVDQKFACHRWWRAVPCFGRGCAMRGLFTRISHLSRSLFFVPHPRMSLVKFSGPESLPWRLALSILSGRPVRIDGIRSHDTNPGLRGLRPVVPLAPAAHSLRRLRSEFTPPLRKGYQWDRYRDFLYWYAQPKHHIIQY